MRMWSIGPAWCGLALLVCGCASKSRIEPAAPSAPVALELLERLPPSGGVTASDVYYNHATERKFLNVDENGREVGQVIVKRSATDRFDAAFRDDEGPEESEFWRVDEQGNVVLVAHVDEHERAITHFRPPLVIMPPELPAGEPMTSESSMRIVDLKNPLKVREQGQARRATAYVGDQRLRTPRGEFTAQRLEIKFVADLRLADAEERTILFIVPGEGVIARQTEVTVKILGALTRTDRRTLVRVDWPSPGKAGG